jgi:hypothetical protein
MNKHVFIMTCYTYHDGFNNYICINYCWPQIALFSTNGGKMLEISGPCMFAEHRRTYIACRFGGSSYNFISYGFRVNKMKSKCAVPTLAIRGWIKVFWAYFKDILTQKNKN